MKDSWGDIKQGEFIIFFFTHENIKVDFVMDKDYFIYWLWYQKKSLYMTSITLSDILIFFVSDAHY